MAVIDIKRTVSLDGAIMPVALEGTLYGGENQAHRFIINATQDGAALNLTGSVTASFLRKADSAEVPLTGEIIGGGAAVTLAQSCYTQPGRFELTIFLTQNGSKTALYSCNGNVRNTSASEIVDPGHVVPDISDIVAEYARMQAASEAAEAAAENANEAAQFATDDEWTNGDTLQTGRVYQTLHMANFEEETAGQYLRVISGNVAQAERVNQSGWSVYRYDLPHRMLIRLEAIEKNTPTVQGVLPMAAALTSGNTETLYSLDSDRTDTYILADALLVNYNTAINASAIKNVSITAVANRQFGDVIVCADHAGDFDNIVVFGDSIFANYINNTTVGNGVMAQFASLMGLPVVNNAVGGATLSTIQTNPKSVVQQVQDYIASATPSGTPLYMIDGGTNDQYNGGAGLNNLGQYTDGVNGITNTIYGATYRIINDLLGFGAQPWQIVITTPIPKGIRGDAAYVATMDAQLTAIAGAMAEIAMVQQCNVINGYGAPFDNLTTDTAKAIIMPDDTHPSVQGAKLYAERIFRLLGTAMQPDVAALKSAIYDINDVLTESISLSPVWERGNIGASGNNTGSARYIRSAEPAITINSDSLTLSLNLDYSEDPIMTVCVYDSTGAYVSSMRTHFTASGIYTMQISSGYKVRFLIGCGSHDTETVINMEDADSILQASYAKYVNLETDTTLEIAGRAADAKAVGDALGETNESIDAIEEDISDLQDVLKVDNRIDFTWEKGYISSSGSGGGSTSTTRIRTKTWYQIPKDSFKLYVPSGIRCRVCVYAENNQPSYIGQTYYDGTNDFVTLSITAGYWIKLWILYYPTESDIAISVGDSIYAVYTEGINDKTEELVTARNIARTVSWMSFSMFWKVGVIGDSFASGSLHHPDDGGWTGNYNLSWPQILARQTGADVINFTKGGLSTKTWLENTTYGLAALLAADPQQLYIIALGINDNTQIQAGTLTLGTTADIKADYTQNPDTFYGNYARIIGNIKTHAPYAKIVCLSVMRPNERNMDQYIEEIAEACDVPFINILEDDYFTSDVYYGSMYSSHPIAYGYAGIASAVERLINRCVLANTTYFGTYYGLLDDDTSGEPDESAV